MWAGNDSEELISPFEIGHSENEKIIANYRIIGLEEFFFKNRFSYCCAFKVDRDREKDKPKTLQKSDSGCGSLGRAVPGSNPVIGINYIERLLLSNKLKRRK